MSKSISGVPCKGFPLSFSLYFICVSMFVLGACSHTTFIGQHTALFPLEEGENVLVMDCTGLRQYELPEGLQTMPCDELFTVHIYCINNSFEELTSECIAKFKEKLNSAYVIVPRTSLVRSGGMIQSVSDYSATVHPPGLVDETANIGSVSFDIYDTVAGEKVNTFDVKVRTSGWRFSNKRDRGYTRVNVASDDSNLYKARRKGLKNIAKRIIVQEE